MSMIYLIIVLNINFILNSVYILRDIMVINIDILDRYRGIYQQLVLY